ncbi:hypothetical protein FRB94_008240 [Tulasnella sp. JGI-2019a]|nr:hypothetical protein FRB93_002131 [Tulasnella sp. JGI-2019a]KAG8996514.1 hypothetical protein FRB94_008240 [Tulasnella sp. JGI-2019a]
MSGKPTKEDLKRIEETQIKNDKDVGPNTFTDRIRKAAESNDNAANSQNRYPAANAPGFVLGGNASK